MPTITLNAGATQPPVEATLKDAYDDPLDLSDATSVRFEMGPVKSPHVDHRATIVDEATGRVRYEWRTGDTDTPGTHRAAFIVRYVDGSTLTVPTGEPLFVTLTRRR